jgi:hypothetical protein
MVGYHGGQIVRRYRPTLLIGTIWRQLALQTLESAGVKSVKLPLCSPNLNAHAEPFVRSIKEPCLERMIFFGEASRERPFRTLWSTITPSGIIRASRTGSSAPTPPTSEHQARSSGVSASAAC